MSDNKQSLAEKALEYHSSPVPGKLKIVPTKPCVTQQDLSLAYTPGVAVPCLEIKKNKADVWKYTNRSNTVAVVSDGTAVLGLGNIGPEAGMPVMEGKAVLFKTFADIDAIPLCLGSVHGADGRTDADKLIEAVKPLEPSFGGINLEDIGAPACFKVEQTLKKAMGIPVFHDDQHGTAIISLAGILNALKLVGKKIEECRFVMNGAGAAGIAWCGILHLRRRKAGKLPPLRLQRRHQQVTHRPQPGKSAFRSGNRLPDACRRNQRRGRLHGRIRREGADPRNGREHGSRRSRLRHGEPGTGNLPG